MVGDGERPEGGCRLPVAGCRLKPSAAAGSNRQLTTVNRQLPFHCCCASPAPTTPGSVKLNTSAFVALVGFGPPGVTTTKSIFRDFVSDPTKVAEPVQSWFTV